ncbi:hypothetical protein C0Q78_25240 [Klebsiella pneumoniae]|nr:hypothetical protein CR231_27175 [Klebsiella pneumoniae]MBX4541666.1 hypothetical protein [Klebsiella pneumoniae]MBX4589526.1 hypothetical protein [Klebsiella pneumoniae]MBX4616106.1 hypothetical protein [Klebsiella pneumoniae]MBX4621262.1 hypothetical protein [Klebsiella pneumoniae]
MTSLKTSIKTITYLSDIGCLEIQRASLGTVIYFIAARYLILYALQIKITDYCNFIFLCAPDFTSYSYNIYQYNWYIYIVR